MLTFLPAPILGAIAIFLYALNTLIVPTLVLIVAFFMFIIPIPAWRRYCSRLVHEVIPGWWARTSDVIMAFTTKTEWELQGVENLNPQGWYLLICNHQSWLDIIVLEKFFNHRVPSLKFFMKKELLWLLPIAGVTCWVIGFPFMKRYSKEYLKKHPEKAGKDLEITRRACEKFKNKPMTIVNYIEGTRLTPEKARVQESPYKHLLRPKAAGFSFVIDALSGHLDNIINTTIIYPDPRTTLWHFMCGKTKKIIVHFELIPVTPELIGNYFKDPEFRDRFQEWTNQLWHKKDQLIDTILLEEKNRQEAEKKS